MIDAQYEGEVESKMTTDGRVEILVVLDFSGFLHLFCRFRKLLKFWELDICSFPAEFTMTDLEEDLMQPL